MFISCNCNTLKTSELCAAGSFDHFPSISCRLGAFFFWLSLYFWFSLLFGLLLSHKVRKYKEYHSACPLLGIGTLPTPLSPASVPLSPSPRTGGGGGHTRLWMRGWGSPNSDDWKESLSLCLLCVLSLSFLS